MAHQPLIREALDTFDGKHVDELKGLAANSDFTAEDLAYLFDLIETEGENAQIGASWLLLNGKGLADAWDNALADRVNDILSDDRFHWQTHLHLLQVLDTLPLDASNDRDLCPAVLALAEHPQKFVRAWAISALIGVADRTPTYRDQARKLVTAAQQNESASVQARLRKRLKRCDWF